MTRRYRPPPATRFVYVIGPAQGLQKIGLATDPQSRLAALQTASPFDLLLHVAVAVPFGAAPAIERQAHRLLVRSCVRNEWFETTPTEAIAAVYSAALPWLKKTQPRSLPPPVHPSPSDWRISRIERPMAPPPDPAPLVKALARSDAQDGAPLPLFDYQPPVTAAADFPPDTPLDDLSRYRLELRCCMGCTSYPLGLLASSLPQGGRTSLRAAIGLFRCERCKLLIPLLLTAGRSEAICGTTLSADFCG